MSKPRPEPLDVRIDHAADVVKEAEEHTLDGVDGANLSCIKGEHEGSRSPCLSPTPSPMSHFNPFCAVDQMSLSVHCHIKAVSQLVSSERFSAYIHTSVSVPFFVLYKQYMFVCCLCLTMESCHISHLLRNTCTTSTSMYEP